MKSKLSYLKQFENAPDLLIMHAGGMDIGVKQFPLYRLITNLINQYQVLEMLSQFCSCGHKIFHEKN